MKRYFFVALLMVMVCVTSAFGGEKAGSGFLSQEQVKEDIKNYYEEVLHKSVKLVWKIYLLDMVRSEKDSNFMYVYFMADKNRLIKSQNKLGRW